METIIRTELDARDLSSEEIQTMELALLEFSKQPIDLNTATREILERIPLLVDTDIDALLVFRRSHNKISTLSELTTIPGLSDGAIRLLRVIGYVEETKSVQHSQAPRWIQVRTLIKGKWDSDESPPGNAGSRLRRSIRITGRVQNLTWGLTLQNEPYERFRWRPGEGWYGFDHTSGYLSWSSDHSRWAITIGNFSVDAGQGLVHARPFGTRLSAAAPSQIVRNWSGVRRYTGSSPLSFRGVGISTQVTSSLRLQVFLSLKALDARRDSSIVDPDGFFVLSGSTTHISTEQLSRRRAISSSVAGALIDWKIGSVRVGFQVSSNRFGSPVLKQDETGVRNGFMAGSIYGIADLSSFRFTGEVTVGRGQSSQFVLGSTWKPTRSTRLFAHLYRYDARSIFRFGNPFGFRRSLNSQKGITVGTTFRPDRNWSFSTSLNYYTGLISKEVAFFPITSSDLRFHLQGKLGSENTVTFLLRSKQVQKLDSIILPSGSQMRALSLDRHLQASLLVTHSISRDLIISNRFDTNLTSTAFSPSSEGVHAFQQVTVFPSRIFSVVLRYSLYAAPRSRNNFYIYEPDVLGQLSVPVLSTDGSRSLIFLTIKPASQWKLQVKWTRMRQAGASSIRTNAPHQLSGQRSAEVSERLSVRRVQLLSLQLAVEL